MKQLRENKQYKTKQGEHDIISLLMLFICLFKNIYVYLIMFPINSNRLWVHHASGVSKYLIAFEFADWNLNNWHFRALKVTEGDFVVVSIICFLFLLECIFDARACDWSFLNVDKFIWGVWRCLDFKHFIWVFLCSRVSWELWKHLIWMFWAFKSLFKSFESISLQ